MTKQEIFDTVARHLLKQGRKSVTRLDDGEAVCRYRGEGGDKCAVGILIDDELAAKGDRFNQNVTGLYLGLPPDLQREDRLLAHLQRVHDQNDPAHWRAQLRGIAVTCNLNTAAVDE